VFAGFCGAPRLTAIFGLCGPGLLLCASGKRRPLACLRFVFLRVDDHTRPHVSRRRIQREAPHCPPPAGTVVVRLFPAPDELAGGSSTSRTSVDRALFGPCFSYPNYEPSSGQFRVLRSFPGSARHRRRGQIRIHV